MVLLHGEVDAVELGLHLGTVLGHHGFSLDGLELLLQTLALVAHQQLAAPLEQPIEVGLLVVEVLLLQSGLGVNGIF